MAHFTVGALVLIRHTLVHGIGWPITAVLIGYATFAVLFAYLVIAPRSARPAAQREPWEASVSAPRAHRLSALLPGSWLLTSRIDVTESGAQHPDPLLGEDPVALLIYDRSGHFSAQFMKRDRSRAQEVAPDSANNNTRAQGGYDAYFGTYSVDDATGVVTQRLQGAMSPGNVGMVLTRAMEVHGDTLVIRLNTSAADGTAVTRTLTWQRRGDAVWLPPRA